MSLEEDPTNNAPTNNVEVEDGPTSLFVLTRNDEPELGMTNSQAYNLYTSHFLSTWNVRTYEFAVIIFTAAAYPNTLTAAAVRGIIRTLASICFSSSVGRWVDRSPNRLKTLMSSISVNRLTVICACALWFFILQSNTDPVTLSVAGENPASRDMTFPSLVKNVIFTFILILGIGENLSASGNMMSMERDWVVTAAAPDGYSRDITHLNSVMRRIDLVCKLIAPILISLIISATDVQIGVLVVAGMSAMSWSVEMLSARHVWNRNPALQELKVVPVHTLQSTDGMVPLRLNMLFGPVTRALEHYVQDFRNYFSTTIWIPSFSLSLLHLSALSYGATFITFLLSAGFSLDAITIARAIGSVVEISSTVVTPVGVHILGKASSHGKIGVLIDQRERAALSAPLIDARRSGDLSTEVVEERTVTGLERLGLWGLCWQLLNLVPVLLALYTLSPTSSSSPSPSPSQLPSTTAPNQLLSTIPGINTLSPPSPHLSHTLTLFTFLSLSRLGLWIFDLTTSQLSQTLVPPQSRSAFAGVELSFNAAFELAQHALVLCFSDPREFVVVAGVSIGAVIGSAVLYAGWVRRERGHLIHWERLRACGMGKVTGRWRTGA